MNYYSQCGEDEYIYNNYFKNKKNGKYIELGALDGVLYSNTKFFEDNLNWSGVLIEPHPIKFKNLSQNRPNNYLYNSLVSNIEHPLIFRYFDDNYAGVSGVELTLPFEHYNNFYNKVPDVQSKIVLNPIKLKTILEQTNINYFDFMSLDVEGHEYEVLLSWDFSIPINLILIETLGGSNADNDNKCRKLLNDNGYILDAVYKHNEIYVLKTN